jgi:hypothetical protein
MSNDLVKRTLEEYTAVFSDKAKPPRLAEHASWDTIRAKLQCDMEWTPEGAEQICALAHEYGAFVLRNAFALATVLGIEDGALGL